MVCNSLFHLNLLGKQPTYFLFGKENAVSIQLISGRDFHSFIFQSNTFTLCSSAHFLIPPVRVGFLPTREEKH